MSLSSGIGRTGAYITLDHALKVAKKDEIVDIPAIVTSLREQRKRMVQTLVSEGLYTEQAGRHL